MDSVLKYFEGIFGLTIVAWIVIICLLMYGVWVLAQRYASAKHKSENLPCNKHEDNISELSAVVGDIRISLGKLENLPCTRHDNNISGLEKMVNDVKVSLGKLETGQEDVYKMMSLIAGSSVNSNLTQHQSPISLNSKGIEIANILGLSKVLDNNWDKIKNIITDEKNPYDIQMEFITRLIIDNEKYIDEDSLNRIKTDAFQRGIPIMDYMRMFGVMARDKYFREHGIDIADVDKHAP